MGWPLPPTHIIPWLQQRKQGEDETVAKYTHSLKELYTQVSSEEVVPVLWGESRLHSIKSKESLAEVSWRIMWIFTV